MKITKNEVINVSKLARLDLSTELIDKFADQVGNILDYVDTLKQVDTTNISPTSHSIFLINAFRDDIQHDHLDRTLALKNAPQEEDGYFVVPKIIN
ncbi:MAG: Asp-tRNA(Asn)/Glu-tRNA(Gln) amidotransferase subunit GatC [Desulfobacterales bacterium]|nr:Asp-tRNA(Asn)/Glu-tRNA(Gln) amidotransferase subunit GatC [Desulfobacterales bacterium]